MDYLQEVPASFPGLLRESRQKTHARHVFAETEIDEAHPEGLSNTGEEECTSFMSAERHYKILGGGSKSSCY